MPGSRLRAKKDSAIYVLRKTLARHRGPAIAGFVILGVAAVGLAVSAMAWRRAARDRDVAIAAGDDARAAQKVAGEQEKLSRLAVARSYARQHDFALARETLEGVDAGGTLSQDWRWAAWEFFRRSGEISVVDLNANLKREEWMPSARESSAYVKIDVVGQKIWVYEDVHPKCFDLETGRPISIPADTHIDLPLNWLTRDDLHLEGTKGGRHVVVDAKGWPERTENTIELMKPDGSVAWKEKTCRRRGMERAGSLSNDGRLLTP